MLEILALIFLSRNNGDLAQQKGLKRSTWVWRTVGAWVGMEFFGAFLFLIIAGEKNMVIVYLGGIGSAIFGYFLVKKAIEKHPDVSNDFDFNKE